MTKTPEKQFEERLFRNYIEENKQTSEQKRFTWLICIFFVAPIILYMFLPAVFMFATKRAGIIAMSVLISSQLLVCGYALIRKKKILKMLLPIECGSERIEKIKLTEIDNFDKFYEELAITVCMKTQISGEFMNLVYNWLNNMNVLKEEPLKVFVFTGKLVNENSEFVMEDNTNIMAISFGDLNLTQENGVLFYKKYNFMFGC